MLFSCFYRDSFQGKQFLLFFGPLKKAQEDEESDEAWAELLDSPKQAFKKDRNAFKKDRATSTKPFKSHCSGECVGGSIGKHMAALLFPLKAL